MATFLSTQLTPPAAPVAGVGMGGQIIHSAVGSYTITAALALNDVIALFDVPRNARVVGG